MDGDEVVGCLVGVDIVGTAVGFEVGNFVGLIVGMPVRAPKPVTLPIEAIDTPEYPLPKDP